MGSPAGERAPEVGGAAVGPHRDVGGAVTVTVPRSQCEAETKPVPAIAGDLSRLLREDLGADDDSEVRQLLREGTRLVDLTNRPTAETPTFGTYLYLRDVALLTQRLLWIYAERNGLDAP